MMAGMDDKEDPENSITLEALSGLSRILSELDESSVRQILINICLRIRPCFEKVNPRKFTRLFKYLAGYTISQYSNALLYFSCIENLHIGTFHFLEPTC